MSLCMFADGSAIDEWGITYYANGDVRGADLATKMRYQPDGSLPTSSSRPGAADLAIERHCLAIGAPGGAWNGRRILARRPA